LEDGQIDALAFTSRIQVDNLLSIAAQAGREESLRGILAQGSAIVASVGPVCTKRMLEAGFRVDVEPDHPHMGNLILALAKRLNPDRVKTD
jgi:uroporphyrinogen-III synthase